MAERELFEGLPGQPGPKRSAWLGAFPGRFLRLKVAYEDLLFAGLGLVLVMLAGFCLGVERGKQLGLPAPTMAQVSAGTAAARPLPTVEASVHSPPPAAPSAAAASQRAEGGYGIQLATYAGQASAQEEAQRLARLGISCAVTRHGRYLELRAVGFHTREEAEAALAGLRKTYRDAFIKRLSSSSR